MTSTKLITPLALALLCLGLVTLPASGQSDYELALARARKLVEEHNDHDAALAAYREAESLTDSPTMELLKGVATSALAVQQYRLAAEYSRRAIEIAAGDQERGKAYTLLGVALLERGDVSKRKTKASMEALQAAIDNLGKEARLARFLMGRSLLQLERDEEGSRILSQLVADFPDDQLAAPARALLDDPRRTRKKIVPAFELETLTGQTISDRSLRGQVVLIDVWATWCAPCRASVPHLKKLYAKMEGEKFTILGISVDSNENILRDYVTDSQMAWPQYWDGQRNLSITRLLATGYPTYIVVDHEGVIRFTKSGWSEQVGYTLEREIRSALKAARKAAKKS